MYCKLPTNNFLIMDMILSRSGRKKSVPEIVGLVDDWTTLASIRCIMLKYDISKL